jgi:hypothetical protein
MAVVCALQPIPNQGAHTREDLFSMALATKRDALPISMPAASRWVKLRAARLKARLRCGGDFSLCSDFVPPCQPLTFETEFLRG